MERTGDARIWYTTTNYFKEGGEDQYILAGNCPLTNEQFAFRVSGKPADLYKVVIEGPNNEVNRWIISSH